MGAQPFLDKVSLGEEELGCAGVPLPISEGKPGSSGASVSSSFGEPSHSRQIKRLYRWVCRGQLNSVTHIIRIGEGNLLRMLAEEKRWIAS